MGLLIELCPGLDDASVSRELGCDIASSPTAEQRQLTHLLPESLTQCVIQTPRQTSVAARYRLQLLYTSGSDHYWGFNHVWSTGLLQGIQVSEGSNLRTGTHVYSLGHFCCFCGLRIVINMVYGTLYGIAVCQITACVQYFNEFDAFLSTC